MKSLALAFALAVSALTVSAASLAQQPPQQPAAPANPAADALKQRFEMLDMKREILYEKLRGLTEFQQYLQIEAEQARIERQYQAATTSAATKPVPAAKPAAAPATKK